MASRVAEYIDNHGDSLDVSIASNDVIIESTSEGEATEIDLTPAKARELARSLELAADISENGFVED